MKLRSDVSTKLQLLDNKRGMHCLYIHVCISVCVCVCVCVCYSFYGCSSTSVQDLTVHLERMVSALYVYTRECHKALKAAAVFPFQMELRIDSHIYQDSTEDEESLVP